MRAKLAPWWFLGLLWLLAAPHVWAATAATVTPGNVTLTANAANGMSIGVSILPAATAGHPARRRLGRSIIGVENVRIY